MRIMWLLSPRSPTLSGGISEINANPGSPEHVGEIFLERRLEAERGRDFGFRQREPPGVEQRVRRGERAAQLRVADAAVAGAAVEVVADDPVAGARQVDAQLVRPAGLRTQLDQAGVARVGQAPVARARRPAGGVDLHPAAVAPVRAPSRTIPPAAAGVPRRAPGTAFPPGL